MGMKIKKGCFSIFPHLMCKGLPCYEQVVFIWLFHHANAEGFCFPSLSTLVNECGISKDTVIKSLKKLEIRGYIIKKRTLTKNGDYDSTRYIVNLLDLEDINGNGVVCHSDNPLSSTATTVVCHSDNGVVCHSDNNYNHIELKSYNQKKKKKEKIDFSQFHFLENSEFKKTFDDFLEMRTKIRKPATERAKELILKKLHQEQLYTATEMLEQSITNSWQDVFALRQDVFALRNKTGENNNANQQVDKFKPGSIRAAEFYNEQIGNWARTHGGSE